MLGQTCSEHQNTALSGGNADILNVGVVRVDVDNETSVILKSIILKECFSEVSISYGWAEYWNIVFGSPVVDTVRVVDSLSEELDQGTRSPNLAGIFLDLMHFLENRKRELVHFLIKIPRKHHVSLTMLSVAP